jgi:hypothetical protein
VTYKTGFRLDDCTYCTLYIQNSGLQAIQRYRESAYFTVHVTHALGFSGFTSLFLATDLYQSLSLQTTPEVFFPQPNSHLAKSSQTTSTAISRTRANSRQQLDYSILLLAGKVKVKVKVKVMLRATDSRPVCLGVKHPPGPYDEVFFTVRQLRF